MDILKGCLRNLAILVVIGMVLVLIAPGIMSQVFQISGAVFGPVVLVFLVFLALPGKKRGRVRF